MCNHAKWYGKPIAVHGVPAGLRDGDGDFIGAIDAGYEMSAMDRAEHIIHQAPANLSTRTGWRELGARAEPSVRWMLRWRRIRSGNRTFLFNKAPPVSSTDQHAVVRRRQPAARAAAGAAPGGTVPTSATTAWPFRQLGERYAALCLRQSGWRLWHRTRCCCLRPAVHHEDHEQHGHGKPV